MFPKPRPASMSKAPNEANPPRKGRELEETVARFERGLRGTDYQVTSPDYLVDHVTGVKREVDVSIQHRKTGEYVAIVECRDRGEKEDVTWVEQALSKGRDLSVPLVILVSSRGFTAPAREKAQHYSLGTRMVKQVDPEQVQEWFRAETIAVESRTIILTGYDLFGGEEDELSPASREAVRDLGVQAPILLRTGDLPP